MSLRLQALDRRCHSALVKTHITFLIKRRVNEAKRFSPEASHSTACKLVCTLKVCSYTPNQVSLKDRAE